MQQRESTCIPHSLGHHSTLSSGLNTCDSKISTNTSAAYFSLLTWNHIKQLTSLSLRAKKPSACVLTDTLARSGSGTLAFNWPVFWSARTTAFLVSKKIRAVPCKSEQNHFALHCYTIYYALIFKFPFQHVSLISYLAIGSVNLVDYISKQDLLIDDTVELLIFGVLADLQVVTSEGLVHARREKNTYFLITHTVQELCHHLYWLNNLCICSFIKQ